ncbi:hypothetical protein K0U83_21795 [bacterium]|nr:hypothetical protein [bacterium]
MQFDLFASAYVKPAPHDHSKDYAYWCPHCGALPGELCRNKGRASNLDSDSDGDRIDKTLWVHGMRNQRRMNEYDPPKTWDAWRRIEDATKEE